MNPRWIHARVSVARRPNGSGTFSGPAGWRGCLAVLLTRRCSELAGYCGGSVVDRVSWVADPGAGSDGALAFTGDRGRDRGPRTAWSCGVFWLTATSLPNPSATP